MEVLLDTTTTREADGQQNREEVFRVGGRERGRGREGLWVGVGEGVDKGVIGEGGGGVETDRGHTL